MPSLIQEEAVSCKAILDGMLASPYDLDVQLSGLLNLRHVSTRELLETSSLLMGSSGCSTTAGHPEQSSWRSPEWAHASIRADAEHMGSSASGSGSPAPGKGKGKARMTTSEAPVGAASEVTTAPLVATAGARGSRQSHLGPDADAIDVIVHAMNVGRSHALLQEHACAILAQVATHLVRASLSPKRGGGADVGGGGAGGSGGGGGGGGGGATAGAGAAAATATSGAAVSLPAEALSGAEEQVYAVLVELVNEVAWEKLLEHRAAAFVMEGDAEAADADTAAAAAAAAAGAEVAADGAGGPFGGRKRRCHAWLDALIRALYCDLQVFADWHHEEEQQAARKKKAAGGADGGTIAGGGAASVEGGGGGGAAGGGDGASGAGASSFEWMQRARLATRLQQPAYGAGAWASAVRKLEEVLDGDEKLEGGAREALEAQWTQACAALMQLHAQGDAAAVVEGLAAAKRLLDACGADEAVAPREIAAAVYQMVAAHGLQAVRAAQRSLGEPHPAMNHIFHDVVQWKVQGFSA